MSGAPVVGHRILRLDRCRMVSRMIADIQHVADRLGASLGRPIAVDDIKLRLLAFTSVAPAFNDEARSSAILNREIGAEVKDWITRHRPADDAGVFIVPPNPGAGIDFARWGATAFAGERPAAFVWVVVADGGLSDAEQRRLLSAAHEVGEILSRQLLFDELRTLREREGLNGLLGTDPDQRRDAAARLIEAGIFEPAAEFSLFVLLPVAAHGGDTGDTDAFRGPLDAAVDSSRLLFPSSRFLATVRPNHAVVVVARDRADDRYRSSADIGMAVDRVLADAFAGADVRTFTGIGRRQRRLAEAHASYRQALHAAQVASAIEGLGSPVHYNRLGVYGRLAALALSESDWETLHPGIRTLLERENAGDDLAHTLEAFLDAGGNVVRAAAELHVHRASLYGRLHRIEQITQLDLSDGRDRLVAHLELKVSRLIRSPFADAGSK